MDSASLTNLISLESVESALSFNVLISRRESPLIVPANTLCDSSIVSYVAVDRRTLSIGIFSTSKLSPVIGAWFTKPVPSTTTPSTGILLPGLTTTMSPNFNSLTSTSTKSFPFYKVAFGGVKSLNEVICFLALFIA